MTYRPDSPRQSQGARWRPPQRRRRPRVAALLTIAACLLALAVADLIKPPPAHADALMRLAIQQAQITGSDSAGADWYGLSVALSGDTAIVGARRNAYRGAAYVYVRSGGTWTQQQKLISADLAANDHFGISVAIAGDTALVGASYDDAPSADQGSAYVFVRSGETWTQQAKLVAGDPAANDSFGGSVAISGGTALVGASGDDTGRGAAYVFVRTGVTWTQQKKLIAGVRADWDFFGGAVALSGDTALVGASDDDGSFDGQGSAYVFVRSGVNWTQQQQLTAGGTAGENEYFGGSVALSDDTAVVGAMGDDTGRGSAYVFVRSGVTWTQQQQLTAGGTASAYDFLGTSVALEGDVALVGAGGDDEGRGSAYVFVRSGAAWAQQQRLVANTGSAGDRFGTSSALSGDTALVGAPYDQVTTDAEQGSAYVFTPDLTAPSTTAALTPAANAAGWHRSPVTLTLSATDDLGVDKSFFRFGTGGGFTVYDAAATPVVTAQGETALEYYSADLAGNAETARSVTVRIDSGQPTTRAYAATLKRGKTGKLAYKVSDAVPGCGQAAVTLKVFKGKKLKRTVKVKGTVACNVKKTCRWKCTLTKGRYTIKVYATDLAGNAQGRVGSARLTVT